MSDYLEGLFIYTSQSRKLKENARSFQVVLIIIMNRHKVTRNLSRNSSCGGQITKMFYCIYYLSRYLWRPILEKLGLLYYLSRYLCHLSWNSLHQDYLLHLVDIILIVDDCRSIFSHMAVAKNNLTSLFQVAFYNTIMKKLKSVQHWY